MKLHHFSRALNSAAVGATRKPYTAASSNACRGHDLARGEPERAGVRRTPGIRSPWPEEDLSLYREPRSAIKTALSRYLTELFH
jgi:hypothetical protein